MCNTAERSNSVIGRTKLEIFGAVDQPRSSGETILDQSFP